LTSCIASWRVFPFGTHPFNFSCILFRVLRRYTTPVSCITPRSAESLCLIGVCPLSGLFGLTRQFCGLERRRLILCRLSATLCNVTLDPFHQVVPFIMELTLTKVRLRCAGVGPCCVPRCVLSDLFSLEDREASWLPVVLLASGFSGYFYF